MPSSGESPPAGAARAASAPVADAPSGATPSSPAANLPRPYPAVSGSAPESVSWNGSSVPVPDLALATPVARDPLAGTILAASGAHAAVDGRMLTEVSRALGGEVPSAVIDLLRRAQDGAGESELRAAVATLPDLPVRVALGRWIAARYPSAAKPTVVPAGPPPSARF